MGGGVDGPQFGQLVAVTGDDRLSIAGNGGRRSCEGCGASAIPQLADGKKGS